MRLRGVRGSHNIEDRRGKRGKAGAGIGGVGLLVLLAVGYFTGFDVTPLLQGQGTPTQSSEPRELSAEEKQAGEFFRTRAGNYRRGMEQDLS